MLNIFSIIILILYSIVTILQLMLTTQILEITFSDILLSDQPGNHQNDILESQTLYKFHRSSAWRCHYN